jgi:outer membrane protein assembly factor BamB
VVVDESGQAAAFSLRDGTPAWTRPLDAGVRHPPAVIAGSPERIVFVNAADGALTVLDAATGALAWRADPTQRSDGPAAADGTFVAYGNCDAAVHVFRAADGSRAARVSVGPEGDAQMAGGLALWDGAAFGGTRDGALVRVDLSRGRLCWRAAVADGECFVRPAVLAESGLVVTGTRAGEVVAVSLAGGAVRWRADAGTDAVTGLAALDGRLWVTAGSVLTVLAGSDGILLASRDTGTPLSAPAAAGGTVVVAGEDGTVAAWAFGATEVRP